MPLDPLLQDARAEQLVCQSGRPLAEESHSTDMTTTSTPPLPPRRSYLTSQYNIANAMTTSEREEVNVSVYPSQSIDALDTSIPSSLFNRAQADDLSDTWSVPRRLQS